MSSYFADPKKQRRVAYIVLGAIVLILIITGIAVFKHAKATKSANDKANQLITELQSAGLPVPSQQQLARYLGEDGGSVCEDPSNALKRAALYAQLGNGAAGPGQRPIIGDSNIVKGMQAIIKVYCPQELAEFNQNVANLKFDDVIKEK
jgi:hypothetical protein